MNTEFADEHLDRLAMTGNSRHPELVRREIASAKQHFKYTREEMQLIIRRGIEKGWIVNANRSQPGNAWRP
jgi:hypothetical protein